ncbi:MULTISPECIES: methyl-accepting chemotaxis protein [Massilia]|jgi:methyl-accepting chemotaxis protein|uniref:methyl-accepting chemotaxis protein n=1 Tax=Massilia TaxID=149698 RepID=UPI000428622F|nr:MULTISPECIES: methyl-accepting chemotaxis protein [Massilia]
MKLRNKMAWCMAIVFVLFTVALAVALSGMRDASARFGSFVDHDQAFLGDANTMYSQGLQMGQALRNIILAPDNGIGYKNLAAARKDFDEALKSARTLAAADPATQAALGRLETLQRRRAAVQDRILELVKSGTDTASSGTVLNAEETPVWRDMRAELLKILKEKKALAEQDKTELIARTQTMLALSLTVGAFAIVAGGAVAFWLTRSITRQLGGEPAYAASIAGAIAAGDLTVQIDLDDERNQASLMFAMRQMQRSLATLVHKVRVGTDTITTASSEIAAGNLDLSARTEEQASSLEETAASMEELTSTVQQNSESVRHANMLAGSASEVALKGGQVVEEVVGTMGAISEAARRIADIIGVIDGIAFQTNILALNAAVEAARAGEQGRGFAVVASEVRNLAQRSAAAAKEIKTLIGDSVGKVEAGSKLVNVAGETMTEVVASVKRVTDIMAGIALAGQEQSAGIAQVNQAIAQMDQVTQQNAALVEEAAAAADSMQAQAQELLAVVSTFKLASAQVAHRPRIQDAQALRRALPAAVS